MAVLIHQVIGMNTITKLARLLLAKEEQVRGLLIGWISLFLQELTHILLKRTKTNYCNGLHIIFKNEANYIHAMSIRSRYTSTC